MFKCSTFTVRDGALIGDLRDALQPMVWRMELSRVHAAGFKVVSEGGHWDLVIEGTKGEGQTVASYATQALAQRALRRLSRALQRQEWGRFVFRLAVFAVVILILYFIINMLANTARRSFMERVSGPLTSTSAPVVQGQSQSADQALTPPSR